jgi:hypothetical protein
VSFCDRDAMSTCKDKQANAAPWQMNIIANPFDPESDCFMPGADNRKEYVFNEKGLLYMGSINNIHGKPWSFDQASA